MVVPLESYADGPVPGMKNQTARIQLAETLGFTSVWFRDVPFNVPSFGDAGQVYDPFVYLGLLAGKTERIALGVASIVLPLRHPVHVAKAAASVDVLSGGRLILGVASGDRPDEYPALNLPFENRGERFRESFHYIRKMEESAPQFESSYGNPGRGMDLLPKSTAGKRPLLVTGGSQQSPEWIAEHADGWMLYPRSPELQSQIVGDWQRQVEKAGRPPQPVMQSLYVDLLDDPDAPPRPIHLGFSSGSNYLYHHLKSLKAAGINHVALNLRFNQADIGSTLHRLAKDLLPRFSL
ncbi:LLM class oxidoreductase [Kiritimatiellaeota bacterium B1221]|nr:LLM class oxidoreductase [Kiritimatiellaeota bacterium B1221]